jgi:hypothetical protein
VKVRKHNPYRSDPGFGTHSTRVVGLGHNNGGGGSGGRDGGGFGEPEVGGTLGGSFPGSILDGRRGMLSTWCQGVPKAPVKVDTHAHG